MTSAGCLALHHMISSDQKLSKHDISKRKQRINLIKHIEKLDLSHPGVSRLTMFLKTSQGHLPCSLPRCCGEKSAKSQRARTTARSHSGSRCFIVAKAQVQMEISSGQKRWMSCSDGDPKDLCFPDLVGSCLLLTHVHTCQYTLIQVNTCYCMLIHSSRLYCKRFVVCCLYILAVTGYIPAGFLAGKLSGSEPRPLTAVYTFPTAKLAALYVHSCSFNQRR